MSSLTRIALALFGITTFACGNDGGSGGTAADQIGVGAMCTGDTDCLQSTNVPQKCLTEFKGGYCGIRGCTKDVDCPNGSRCVSQGGTNYCFRICTDKSQCNLNRTPADESNCSASVTFVEGKTADKACLPPSSG